MKDPGRVKFFLHSNILQGIVKRGETFVLRYMLPMAVHSPQAVDVVGNGTKGMCVSPHQHLNQCLPVFFHRHACGPGVEQDPRCQFPPIRSVWSVECGAPWLEASPEQPLQDLGIPEGVGTLVRDRPRLEP